MSTSDVDLLVVGGGAAGLAAARTGVRRNRRVLMVQDGPVGGDCTFTGCVPSKTLIESAAAGLDFVAAMARARETVARIAATETADVLRAEGVEVLQGRGCFTAPGVLRAGGRSVRSARIVLATGSFPHRPAVSGLEDPLVLDTDSFWGLRERPASLIVLGGGPSGCEIAQAAARLGTAVTLVEAASRLLPGDEPGAGAVLGRVFAAQGIDVRCGAGAAAISVDSTVRLRLASGELLRAERLLVATGRTPATGGLDAPTAGVRLGPAGQVLVNPTMATSARGVWAAGDVTGRLMTTHAADEMGRIAALNALLRPLRFTLHARSIPRVVYTDPEVAQVGLIEAQAAREGALVAYLPMSEVDRAITAGRTEGYLKLIARPRLGVGALGRLVGASVVAPRAGEVIHELALAIRTGMAVGRLAQTVHAYPTWSTAVRSAAAQFLFEIDGRAARPARNR